MLSEEYETDLFFILFLLLRSAIEPTRFENLKQFENV